MVDQITSSIEGIATISKRLQALGQDYRKKGMRFATRKGAQVIVGAAKKKADTFDDAKTPTSISKNIVERFSNSYYKRTGNIKFRVGVLGGARKPSALTKKAKASDKYLKPKKGAPGGITYYWRYKEFGTRFVAPDPFLRPAAENNQAEVFAEIAKHGAAWTGRAIKRLNKIK